MYRTINNDVTLVGTHLNLFFDYQLIPTVKTLYCKYNSNILLLFLSPLISWLIDLFLCRNLAFYVFWIPTHFRVIFLLLEKITVYFILSLLIHFHEMIRIFFFLLSFSMFNKYTCTRFIYKIVKLYSKRTLKIGITT